jgi:uncharacterized protein
MACEYCYEKPFFEDATLTPRMTGKIINWISRELQRSGAQHFDLFLYGGEPLLNPAAAKRLLAFFRAVCRAARIRFSADVNTNGLLLSPQLARNLAEHGLGHLTVSIDGPPEVQSSRRGGRWGDFDRILDTLRESARYLNVAIRSNIDMSNYRFVGALLQILRDKALLRTSTYSVVVMADCNVPRCTPREKSWQTAEDPDAAMQALAQYLAEITVEFELPPVVSLASFVGETCNNMAANSFTFDVDGTIYRSSCAAVSRYAGHRLGYVERPGLDENAATVLNEELWWRCIEKDCPYVPICQGGCQADRYLNHITDGNPRCPREEFRRGLRAYLTYCLRLSELKGQTEGLIWSR